MIGTNLTVSLLSICELQTGLKKELGTLNNYSTTPLPILQVHL